MLRKGHDLAGLPDGGIYALVLYQLRERVRIHVGALGAVEFPRGYYCYVGSAQRALAARLRRHLRRTGKAVRWHIDYLRRRTRAVGVLAWEGDSEAECVLSRTVGELADATVRRFGSSDCSCPGHLHYFAADPAAALSALRMPGMRTK